MVEVDPDWSVSVVVCCNERPASSRRGCCGRDAGQALRHWLRDRARAEGLRPRLVVHGGHCMDVCGAGTTVAIHADGVARRVFVVGGSDADRDALWREVVGTLDAGSGLGRMEP